MADEEEADIAVSPDEEQQPETGPLRQPIVAVLGHVDHGKTSLLDWVRGTTVVSREAGAITQHIGATEVPFETITNICGALLPEENIRLPGLLFIDTPGHHSFSTLRARGGQLADMAVLVVDVREGFKPQTVESLQILRRAKTPFIVALNKLDRLPGWRTRKGPFLASHARQSTTAQTTFQERIWEVVRTLGEHGFDSALFTDVQDFQKTIALVPTSVKQSGEGVPELFMLLLGLAQRYLEGRLTLHPGPAEGTVLEVKEERGLG
ncbi:MAG: GTP-binding protein, partial [Candidatus Thermoplasmatota archaeon]|nr:GTP-binding protein [Candidatus Thermoplasmatota archaeon]